MSESRLTGLPKTAEFRVVDRLLRSFSQAQSREAVAELLVATTTDRLPCQRAAYLGWDSRLGCFVPLAASPAVLAASWNVHYYPSSGLMWQMITDDQPFPVSDGLGQPIYPEKRLIEAYGVRTLIPASDRDGVVGLLMIDSRLPPDQAPIIRLLVSRAAEAIASLGLRQQVSYLKQELNKRKAALFTFQEWGDALVHLEDHYHQIEELLDKSRTLLEAERGSIMLVDATTDELVVRAVRGVDTDTEEMIREGSVPSLRIKVGEGVAGQVAQSGSPKIVQDVRSSNDFIQPGQSFVDSLLCVPLTLEGLVLGVMNFTNKRKGQPWTRRDLRRAVRLAEQAAQALNNARLYHLAVTDPATGLANRDHFHHRLQQEILRSKRDGKPLTLCLIKVDNLGWLRSQFDAGAVNDLIAGLAEVLLGLGRRTDTTARLGEVTFGLLWPGCEMVQSLELEARIFEQVREFEQRYAPPGARLQLRFASQTSGERHDNEIALLTSCYDRLRQTEQRAS